MEDKYFDEKEKLINEHIVNAWNLFCELQQTHPDDIKDFHHLIHQLQCVMGMRLLRRLAPEIYMTITQEEKMR